MDPLITSSLIGLGGSLLGGLFGSSSAKNANSAALEANRLTNETNMKINQSQIDFQRQAMEKQMNYNTGMYLRQYADNLAQWNRQNEYNEDMYNKYNSPQARAQQYREAGINPALAVSGMSGSFGSVASQMSNGANPMGLTMGDKYSPLPAQQPNLHADNTAGIWSSFLDAAAQFASRTAAVNKTQEEVKGLRLDNMTRYAANIAKLDNIRQDTNSKHVKASLDQIEYDLRRSTFDSSVEQANLNNLSTRAQIGVSVAQTNLIKSETALNAAKLQWLPEQMRTQLANMNAQTMVLAAQRKLTYEQALTEATKRTLNLANAGKANSESSLAREKGQTEIRTRRNMMTYEQARRLNAAFVSKEEYDAIATDWLGRQRGQDYYNPFNYVGKALNGGVSASGSINKKPKMKKIGF